MAVEITQQEALTHLGASTAEAVARVLEMFVPDGVERGEVTVIPDTQDPFANLPVGGIAASVRYVDGVSGANVFIMPHSCARVLATAMGVGAEDGPLTELEMSAVGEASNQMLASAAAAISVVIGQEIEISPPDVRILDGKIDATDVWGRAPFAAQPRSRSPANPVAWSSSSPAPSSCGWLERSMSSAWNRAPSLSRQPVA